MRDKRKRRGECERRETKNLTIPTHLANPALRATPANLAFHVHRAPVGTAPPFHLQLPIERITEISVPRSAHALCSLTEA